MTDPCDDAQRRYDRAVAAINRRFRRQCAGLAVGFVAGVAVAGGVGALADHLGATPLVVMLIGLVCGTLGPPIGALVADRDAP